MLLEGLEDTNSTDIVSTGEEDNSVVLELNNSHDLTSLEVELDRIVQVPSAGCKSQNCEALNLSQCSINGCFPNGWGAFFPAQTASAHLAILTEHYARFAGAHAKQHEVHTDHGHRV